jgi:ankyrin repeat protein
LPKRRHKRTAIIAGLIALLLLACLGWMAYSGIRQDRLDRALFLALARGKTTEVTALLHQGANPSARDSREEPPADLLSFIRELLKSRKNTRHGTTALIFTAKGGNNNAFDNREECLRALVAGGADVNAQDKDGWTVIMHYIRVMHAKSDTDTAVYLLNHGANPNLPNSDGETALHLAAGPLGSDDLRLLNELIAHGATVDKPNNFGVTALHYSAIFEQAEWVKVLLAHGANPNIRDMQGKTALDFIKGRSPIRESSDPKSKQAILQALKSAGAK